ncbi:MAG: hypothetical protein K6G50_02275 [bacterium]|nr:hypothetical protein [bacterium]
MNKTITFLKKSAALFCFSIILMGTFACTDKNKDNPTGGDNNNQPPAVTTPEDQQANVNQPAENNPNPPGPGENQPGPDNNQPGPDNNQPGPDNNQPAPDNQPQGEHNPQVDIEALNNEVVITDKNDANYGKTRKEIMALEPDNIFARMSDDEYIKYATRPEGTDQEIRDSLKAIEPYTNFKLSFDKHTIEKLIANHTSDDIKKLSENASKDFETASAKFREFDDLPVTKEVNMYFGKISAGMHQLVRAAEQASKLSTLSSDKEVVQGLNDIRFILDCAKDDFDSGKRIGADVAKEHTK